MGASPRLLIVTAVAAERDAAARRLGAADSLLRGYPVRTAVRPCGRVDVIAGGVGAPSAATAAATALSGFDYDLVISAGVAGGFPPAGIGEVIVASSVVRPQFGAASPDGFLPASAIGLGKDVIALDAELVGMLAERASARVGPIATVDTVTGTSEAAEALRQRYPGIIGEAMEGAGVAVAAQAHGVAMAEVRTVSNAVGPRDRSSWRLDDAFAALSTAIESITANGITS